MELTSCTADQNQESDDVGDPNILTNEMNSRIADKGNEECDNGDYSNRPFDRERRRPYRPKTLSSSNSCQNGKDSNLEYDDYGKEGIWIFSEGLSVSISS